MKEVIRPAEEILRSERIKGLLCLPHSYNKLTLSFIIFCLTEWFKKCKLNIWFIKSKPTRKKRMKTENDYIHNDRSRNAACRHHMGA